MIKWDKPCGVGQKLDREAPVPGICYQHKLGVSPRLRGKVWLNPGCPVCEAKAIANPALMGAPTSAELLEASKRTKLDPRKFARMWAGKHAADKKKARYAP
jgi:hypothetical protein